MDKRIVLWTWIALLALSSLMGCGEKDASASRAGVPGQRNTVASVLEANTATEAPTAAPRPAATAAPKATASPLPTIPGLAPRARIDVDLASMSSTMVYSEVFSMMEHPQDYVGKIVRMRGLFAYNRNEELGAEYYFCVIQDATACCAQGIEFILAGDPAYPDAYPSLWSEFTVTGVFEDYREGDNTYYHLRDAVLEA